MQYLKCNKAKLSKMKCACIELQTFPSYLILPFSIALLYFFLSTSNITYLYINMYSLKCTFECVSPSQNILYIDKFLIFILLVILSWFLKYTLQFSHWFLTVVMHYCYFLDTVVYRWVMVVFVEIENEAFHFSWNKNIRET